MKKHQKEPKKVRNEPLIRLRKIIGKTQAEFATMIGVSLDLIKGVESGRNKPSFSLVRNTFLATGVDGGAILKGSGLPAYAGLLSVYTKAHFDDWNNRMFPSSEDAVWEKFDSVIAPEMLLIFLAAIRKDIPKKRDGCLTNLLESWSKWAEHAIAAFDLGNEMQDILNRFPVTETKEMTWGEWRKTVKDEENSRKEWNKEHSDNPIPPHGSTKTWWLFKDDPSKKDTEILKLTATSHYVYSGAWCSMGDMFERLKAAKGTFGPK